MTPTTLGIVGTGLIGASIGLASRAAGSRVIGYDLDPRAAEQALGAGALSEIVGSAAEAVRDADVVVIAAPAGATVALLAEFPPAPRAALILDVASVKRPVARAAAGVRGFVGTHPIAGSERSGPQAARADLFAGREWAVVPPGDPELEERAHAFVRRLGARPFAIGAERHDALIAFTSHLPQVVATALASMLAERIGEPGFLELCGPGVRSTLRLAESPWSVWAGILDENRAAVAQEARSFADVLRSVAAALERRDGEALATRFAAAAAASQALESNDAASSTVISDTPPRGIK